MLLLIFRYVYLSACLSISLSGTPFNFLSVCLSSRMTFSVSVYLFLALYIPFSLSSAPHPPLPLSLCLFSLTIHFSIFFSLFLSYFLAPLLLPLSLSFPPPPLHLSFISVSLPLSIYLFPPSLFISFPPLSLYLFSSISISLQWVATKEWEVKQSVVFTVRLMCLGYIKMFDYPGRPIMRDLLMCEGLCQILQMWCYLFWVMF